MHQVKTLVVSKNKLFKCGHVDVNRIRSKPVADGHMVISLERKSVDPNYPTIQKQPG